MKFQVFYLAGTAKAFFIVLNDKTDTQLAELDVDNDWLSKQLEKQLHRHRNLQTLTVFTDQLINNNKNNEKEIDFKLKNYVI